jgi:SAM-dependent methyltransferase
LKQKNFNTYSKYYDLLYKDKDYQSEAGYVADIIKAECPDAKNIIELGCGTGNHAAKLCKYGYRLTGLEISKEMVTLAKEKNIEGFNPLVADITDFTIEEKYDVAISLFHVISYISSNTDLISCFKKVNEHLNSKGIFIFDVWYSPAVYIQNPETRIKRMSNDIINVTRIAESVLYYNSNTVEVNYEIMIQNKETSVMELFKEKHTMRHFSIPEIELLATHTNFNLIKTEEFSTKKNLILSHGEFASYSKKNEL